MAKIRRTLSILATRDSSSQFVSHNDVLLVDLLGVAKFLRRRVCVRLLASRRRQQGSTTNAAVLDCLAQARGRSEARTNATANEPARRRLPLGTKNGPLMVVLRHGQHGSLSLGLRASGSELKT